MAEVIPSRTLNLTYIYLDIIFLTGFCLLLFFNKRYITLIAGLLAGVLYTVVDYGIFYLAVGTRTVEGANTFWFLLWLSMSYGITNFAWIWLFLNKDKRFTEWSVLIIAWWIACPMISQNFGGAATISISRGTNSYHGVMALIMFAGYAYIIVKNISQRDPTKRINILRLIAMGVFVQFAWEASLLVTGIRAQGFGPLIVNSLIETNLGMPYCYFIFKAVSSRRNDDLTAVTPETQAAPPYEAASENA